ncbi:MAG: malto-oligosyltrehalose synthase [Verrucomicrobiota bacterium]
MKLPAVIPRATYRVQMNAKFTFADLAKIIPYLAELGISDVYLSPIFRATPGSMHGYDVCDPNAVNPELGGREGLMEVHRLLREHGMGMILDFVPNHMGVEGPHNRRWMDVLEHGRASRFAGFFDIEWNPRQTALQDRIMVPMLHDFYGRVLEHGDLRLAYEDERFWVHYRTLRFPLAPESYGMILERVAWLRNPGAPVSRRLEKLAEQFRSLPKPATAIEAEVEERHRAFDVLRRELAALLADEEARADLKQILAALNGEPGNGESFDNLHQLLEEQNYRLAYWKTGTHEINYRRFFAVDTLVGLRMEAKEVFDECHRLLRELFGEGIATGVRVDHIDGLWDPAEYLEWLASLAREPFYTLVEKILAEKEEMRAEWKTHGTTGYDFTGSLVNLLLAARSENEFTRIYREFAGVAINPHEQAYQLKLSIMDELFPNALDNFALDLEARVKSDRRWRDWTVADLRPALSRIIACLSVYRTYRVVGRPAVAEDVAVVDRAVAEALRLNPSADPLPYRFIGDLWTGRYPDRKAGPELQAWAEGWVCNLQQYTGAIMAKSIEDTFFYRYVRLFAANEVGHYPAEFGRPVSDFHESNRRRLEHWPASMLGHLHARHEDERGRARAAAGAVGNSRALGRGAASLEQAQPRGKDDGEQRARARPERGVPALPGAARRVAARRKRRGRGIPRPHQGLHAQGAGGIGSAHELVQPERAVARGLRPVYRHDPRPEGVADVPRGIRRVRAAARRAGHEDGAGAGRAEADRAGRARLLPGQRDLGFQPGRSRQPAAGRLRDARAAAARHRRGAAGAPAGGVARRPDQAAADARAAALPPRVAGALRARRLRGRCRWRGRRRAASSRSSAGTVSGGSSSLRCGGWNRMAWRTWRRSVRAGRFRCRTARRSGAR